MATRLTMTLSSITSSVNNARRLAAHLSDGFTSDQLQLLRYHPFEAIPLVAPEVQIELVETRSSNDCSVEGLYREESRSITVQRALSARRMNFTALHELGHDRARHDLDVARALAKLGVAAGRRLEEKIADAFAAMILIPDSAVDDVLEGRAPTAHDVANLFHHMDVNGSREACCVRVAQRMRGTGYVVLGEDETVRFCATVGHNFRVRRGTLQGPQHLIAIAARRGSATSTHVRLKHASGTETPEFSGQAILDGSYVFAILTDATTLPWGGWILPRAGQALKPSAPEILCLECDDISEAWQQCDTDSNHRVCSKCRWCECRVTRTNIPEKLCDTCFLRKRLDLFPNGGDTCIDH